MSRLTPRLSLNVWDQVTDPFSHDQLAANWDAIDAQAFISKGVEIVQSLPTSGNFPGRVVMLGASAGGFPAWTLMKYDGSQWAPIGSIEIHSQLPTQGGLEGRAIILSAADGGFAPWTLVKYGNTGWRAISDISVAREGQVIATRNKLNFIEGGGIDITLGDDQVNQEIDITLAASVGSILVKKNGSLIGQRSTINFIPADNMSFTITDTGTAVSITPNVTDAPTAANAQLLAYTTFAPAYNWTSPVQIGNPPRSTPWLGDWDAATVSFANQLGDNDALKLSFTSPIDGEIVVEYSAYVRNTKSDWAFFCMKDGVNGTVATETKAVYGRGSTGAERTVTFRREVTLTPTTAYDWWVSVKNLVADPTKTPIYAAVWQLT